MAVEATMRQSRYVIVNEDDGWKIVRAGCRHSDLYSSKTQALHAAIAFAERDGLSGCDAEVLVRHEDGRFATEWMFGVDPNAAKSARPIAAPKL